MENSRLGDFFNNFQFPIKMRCKQVVLDYLLMAALYGTKWVSRANVVLAPAADVSPYVDCCMI